MRILVGRRFETMRRLAYEFGVSDRTIRTDILALTTEYPLETTRGNGGGVRLAEWYRPNKCILSREQQAVLTELQGIATPHQVEVLQELLNAYGSRTNN